MPAISLYPNSGGLVLAAQLQTYLALSKLRLFQQGLTPGPNTTHAQLVAALATYDGYADKTLTTWNVPYLDPAGGASIQPGTQQFNFVAGGGTTNTIGGYWIEDAAANVIAIASFDAGVPMVQNGDSIPLNVVLNNFANG